MIIENVGGMIMDNKINASFACNDEVWKDAGLFLGNNRSIFLENSLKNILICFDYEKAEAGYGNQTKNERIEKAVETLERIYAETGSIGLDTMEQLCMFRRISRSDLESNLSEELRENIVEYTLRTKETKSKYIR